MNFGRAHEQVVGQLSIRRPFASRFQKFEDDNNIMWSENLQLIIFAIRDSLAGCGKTYLLLTSLSAPCDKVGLLPLVLPLWGRLQRGKAGCGRPFSAAC